MYIYILLLLIYNTTGENIPLHHISTTTCTTTCYNIIDTYSIIRMCVSMAACIAEGRLAPANGRNPGRQDCRAAPVCSFVVPKMGPKTGLKNGPHYCQKKERLPKWRPRFWDQGVACTVSPPLRAVSSGNSGTFRLFSWQWAWQSLIQVSQYI